MQNISYKYARSSKASQPRVSQSCVEKQQVLRERYALATLLERSINEVLAHAVAGEVEKA